MKYIMMFAAIGMGVFTFVTSSGITSFQPFEYENATLEEQQAWMDGQANTIRKAARWFLPSGRGPSELNMYLKDVVTDAKKREMLMSINVKVPYGARVSGVPKQKFLDGFCKNYVKSGLYKQKIKFMADFINQSKNRRISRITVYPSDCRWAEKKA